MEIQDNTANKLSAASGHIGSCLLFMHPLSCIQVNTLKSKTLKSNFAQFKASINFLTKAALCMTNFTTYKSKPDKSNFG